MGAEFLELDLGFEAVLSFHHYVHQFVPVVVPLFDASEVAGTALIVEYVCADSLARCACAE